MIKKNWKGRNEYFEEYFIEDVIYKYIIIYIY